MPGMTEQSGNRLDNLLAALALGLVDQTTAAVERATGLSGSGPSALLALRQFLDGCNVSRLAAVLGLTHSGAVRLAAQLEATGHVRRAHLTDRRQVNVLLTAKGRKVAAEAAAARMRSVTEATQHCTDAERRQLEVLVADLVDHLVTVRTSRRIESGTGGAWWCRCCDFTACGREEGRCPAAAAAAVAANPEL